MFSFYLLQKYLDSKNDTKFIALWEKLVVRNFSRFIITVFFSYLFVILSIGWVFGEVSFFLGLFAVFFFGFLISTVVVRNTIKFLGVNNQRYLLCKMTPKGNNNNIDYDNVVG